MELQALSSYNGVEENSPGSFLFGEGLPPWNISAEAGSWIETAGELSFTELDFHCVSYLQPRSLGTSTKSNLCFGSFPSN